jgi:hypothetical protein
MAGSAAPLHGTDMRIDRINFVLTALILSISAVAAESQPPSAPPPLSYADLADLGLEAPVVAQVRLLRANRLKPAEAPGIAPGRTRFYVEAEVLSLIRAPGEISAQVNYLVDLPNLPGGKPAQPRKKDERLIFAAPVPNRPGTLRLLAPDAQMALAPADVERLRAVLREASAPRAAPRISGIGKAFYVPGTLPGESETQIFLNSADNRPLSLSILRRPGEAPRWSVALSEIVDEGAGAPPRDTLLWYRLACGLPRWLPRQSLGELEPAAATAVQADYQLVLQSLGPCTRSRRRA